MGASRRREAWTLVACLLGGPLPSGCGAPPQTVRMGTTADGAAVLSRTATLDALGRIDHLMQGFYLAHPDAEAMKARARGETVEGPPPPAGLALHGVRADSWVARLGLREADVLQRLDGTLIDSPTALLSAGWRLRGRLEDGAGWGFEADIVREGRPMTLRYVVRNGEP